MNDNIRFEDIEAKLKEIRNNVDDIVADITNFNSNNSGDSQ